MAEMTQSEKMKAYWAEKKAREAEALAVKKAPGAKTFADALEHEREKETAIIEGIKEYDRKMDEEKPVKVETRSMPFTLEPIAPIPTDRETFDALVAQMSTMTSGGARETIIDQNRALLLSGIAQGWNIGTWMERKEKKEGA
jgi:hypothetical protein